LINSVRDILDTLSTRGQGLLRPMRKGTGCTGTGGMCFVDAAVGIPVDAEYTVGCDTSDASRRFCRANHAGSLRHMFSSLAAMCHSSIPAGECSMCDQYCVLAPFPQISANSSNAASSTTAGSSSDGSGANTIRRERYDSIAFGSPCPPFSTQNKDRFAKGSAAHKDFKVTFGPNPDTGSVLEALDTNKPHGGSLEQVWGFTLSSEKEEGAPVDWFIEKLQKIRDFDGSQLYTGIKVVKLDHSIWMESVRLRWTTCVSCLRLKCLMPLRLHCVIIFSLFPLRS
jgi:hypothetical protein